MRPIRSIATVLLMASIAVAGCARNQPDQRDTAANQPPGVTTPAVTAPPATKAPGTESVVLADGRHPVVLKTVDPARRTITFDLIQLYVGDEAKQEQLKDQDTQYPAPNGYYIRNVNPRLRTLPVRADATITVITLAWQGPNYSDRNVPVSLTRLAAYMPTREVPFWITVRHGQMVKIAEQFIP